MSEDAQLETRMLARSCADCGRKIRITVYPDGHYRGGQYYGRVSVPVGSGETKKIGTMRISSMKVPVVRWTGEKIETEY